MPCLVTEVGDEPELDPGGQVPVSIQRNQSRGRFKMVDARCGGDRFAPLAGQLDGGGQADVVSR